MVMVKLSVLTLRKTWIIHFLSSLLFHFPTSPSCPEHFERRYHTFLALSFRNIFIFQCTADTLSCKALAPATPSRSSITRIKKFQLLSYCSFICLSTYETISKPFLPMILNHLLHHERLSPNHRE